MQEAALSPEAQATITQLANALGVGVSELWRVAKSMPLYHGLRALTNALVAAGCAALVWYVCIRRAEEAYDPDLAIASVATVTGIALLVGVVLFADAAGALLGMLNPDAYALEYILNRLSR